MGEFAVYEAFSPRDYLHAYYGELQSEADGLLSFLVDRLAPLPDKLEILEFGGGPTLIGVIPAARRAASIHFCDYVEANRTEVSNWLSRKGDTFDWSPFIARCLELEGSTENVAERAARMRHVVYSVTACDIFSTPPVSAEGLFDVVISNYCLDAVTDSKPVWHDHIRNLKGLLKPGGLFVFSSLLRARFSDFGETRYPNVYLEEQDVREALAATGFDPATIVVETAPADHDSREYEGVIFGAANTIRGE